MMRSIIILALLLCATAQAQFMPVGFWTTAAATWTPASVASLGLWVSSDAITGKSAGDTLYSWPDRSGKNRHLYQLDASKKPVYRADSLNGKPCVVFDATDDRMDWDTTKQIAQPFTFFVVYKPAKVTSTGNMAITDRTGGAGAPRVLVYQRNSSGGAFAAYAGAELYGNLKARADSAYVICAVFNGASSAVYVNGTLQASGNASTYAQVGLSIGGAQEPVALPSSFYELCLYESAVSATDRGAITQYLLTKYNLPAY